VGFHFHCPPILKLNAKHGEWKAPQLRVSTLKEAVDHPQYRRFSEPVRRVDDRDPIVHLHVDFVVKKVEKLFDKHTFDSHVTLLQC
jgi:hypothetical protein